ncbi:CBS domain-containing protein [Pseudomonas sp. NA-150]|uniref:CBS domain-containing protein n=1 Tax=Pseudomonas sp. NA-150 TaxID=3367525 RepID=UPI0037C6072D
MDTSLESAVKRLMEANLDELLVINRQGQPVGQLTLKSIMTTMVSSAVSKQPETVY